MGLVVRHSVKTLIIIYIGLVIGYINTLILYPLVLTESEIGLTRILISASFLFAAFASFGTFNMPARYFPYFENKETHHNGFLFFLISLGTMGFFLFIIFFFVFKGLIFSIYSKNAYLLVKYYYYFIPFTFVALLMSVVSAYIVIQKKPVFPNFVKEVLVRVFMVITLLLYFFKVIDLNIFVAFIIISYAVALIVLIFYSRHMGTFSIRPNFFIYKTKYIKDILNFGLFYLMGNASGVLVANIDSLMLSAYKGLGATGIYTIAFFIATVIEVPRRSLSPSVIPFVSEGNKNNDTNLLDSLYKKSSLNQLIIGGLLFIGIWSNVNNIFHIMPHSNIYIQGKWVVFYIGLGKLFDLATGINGEILGTSKFYKYDLVFLLILGLFAIITNIILIPPYGMLGAALATAFSVFVFNTARFLFILSKMKIQPFTLNTVKVLFICGITLIFNYFIPKQSIILIDIIIRSILLTLLFGGLIVLSKSSEDINKSLIKILKFIRSKL